MPTTITDALLAMKRCPGIGQTDQETGETFSTLIDDALAVGISYNEAIAALAAHHIEMAKQAFEDNPGDKTAMVEFIAAFLGSDDHVDQIMTEAKKQLSNPTSKTCPLCKGTGKREVSSFSDSKKTRLQSCGVCRGKGQLK